MSIRNNLIHALTKTNLAHIFDRRLYLKSFKRIVNGAVSIYNYKNKKLKISNKPLSIFIEPTNICNLKCPSCPTGNGTSNLKKGYMDFKLYKKIIDELGKDLMELFLWNYGESTLNPHIIDMIKYAKKYNLYIQLDTNGTLLNDETFCKKIIDSRLDRITISLDCSNKKSYKTFRGGDYFETIRKGIKKLSDLKKKKKSKFPLIEVQAILMKQNENEIKDITHLSKKLGANELTLRYFILRQYDKRLLTELFDKYNPKKEDYSLYYLKDNKVCYKRPINTSCFILYTTSCILWNGDVVPCCYDGYSNELLGNVKDKGFMNVWNSPKYLDLRKRVISNKKGVPLCMECNSREEWVYKKIYFN